MKSIFLSILLFMAGLTISVAQVGINTDGSNPDASALLDLKSSDKGLLLPRLTAAQRDAISSPAEGLMVFCTNCNLDGTGLISMFVSGQWQNLTGFCPPPATPTAGTHVSTQTQVTWNWNTVSGVIGYRWSNVNDFATATEMGLSTSKIEASLTCGTLYTRYVWAYNGCGYSTPVTLTQSTTECCGDPLTINHLASGGVAPVDKEVTYETVTNIPGETSKCWITRNLGASQQATAVDDATEASAGWYWQFNRKQGYKHDGTTRTPATTWISSIDENSDWTTVNDPCALELGTGWRIPTYTEWYNVDNTGGWTNWNGPWGSNLKMHAAGFLHSSIGSLYYRGSLGHYWGSTQDSNTNGWVLSFFSGDCYMNAGNKAYGFSLRCLRD